jgi:hypothetical protein
MPAHPLTRAPYSPKAAEHPISQGGIDIVDYSDFNDFKFIKTFGLTYVKVGLGIQRHSVIFVMTGKIAFSGGYVAI